MGLNFGFVHFGVCIGLVLGLSASPPLWAQKAKPGSARPASIAIGYIQVEQPGLGGKVLGVSADGAHARVIWDQGRSFELDWSPDGRRMVLSNLTVVRFSEYVSALYIVGVDDGHRCMLIRTRSASGNNPAWSPRPLADGSEWIIYADRSATSSAQELFAVRADCANPGSPVKLTESSEFVYGAAWSPSATRLAAASHSGPTVLLYDIKLVDGVPRLQNKTNLKDLGLFQDGNLGTSPEWAKDDRTLLLSVTDKRDWVTDIWLADLETKRAERLTEHRATGRKFAHGQHMSPDGKKVVYYTPPERGRLPSHIPAGKDAPAVIFMEPGVMPGVLWRLTMDTDKKGLPAWRRTKLVEGLVPSAKWRPCNPCN